MREREHIPSDDPIFRLYELVLPMGPLTNEKIDEAIYDPEIAKSDNDAEGETAKP